VTCEPWIFWVFQNRHGPRQRKSAYHGPTSSALEQVLLYVFNDGEKRATRWVGGGLPPIWTYVVTVLAWARRTCQIEMKRSALRFCWCLPIATRDNKGRKRMDQRCLQTKPMSDGFKGGKGKGSS